MFKALDNSLWHLIFSAFTCINNLTIRSVSYVIESWWQFLLDRQCLPGRRRIGLKLLQSSDAARIRVLTIVFLLNVVGWAVRDYVDVVVVASIETIFPFQQDLITFSPDLLVSSIERIEQISFYHISMLVRCWREWIRWTEEFTSRKSVGASGALVSCSWTRVEFSPRWFHDLHVYSP